MINQDHYKFTISPQTIVGDLVHVNYENENVGVYSGMSSLLQANTNNTSLLTGLTLNILLRQNCVDAGYFSTFDGAILQKDVVCNFIFSSTTQNPYEYKVFNTSDEIQKFLELSDYHIDWGDGSTPENMLTKFPNFSSHLYPQNDAKYTITLKQTNPWGVTKIEKEVNIPYKIQNITNPYGTAVFIPRGGEWSGTPISYDYIFSGDAQNDVSSQISGNYTSIPINISGLTKSKITELSFYGDPKYRPNVPVIKNGQIWGILEDLNESFTAYTINQVKYIDYPNGLTIFYGETSGLTNSNLIAEPITKEEVFIKNVDQPQIQSNVFVERGKVSAYEKIQRLGEVDNLGDLVNYGYGFFVVENKD